MRIPSYLEIKKTSKKGRGVFTKKNIPKGNLVLKFDDGITLRPNSTASITAIQIDEDVFLDSNPKQIRDFLNHSCEPNVRIDFDVMGCIAIKPIKKDTEITFNYLTTEYDLEIKNEEFACFCGSKNCFKIIKGFKHLKKNQQRGLKPILTPYLLRKL